MGDVDLQVFVSTFNTELQRFHPKWQSRIDAGATMKAARLWAGGYLVILDLTEKHLEPGEPGEGGRKYDQIRMAILRSSREPMDEGNLLGGSPESVVTRIWQSAEHGGEVQWTNETGNEVTIEQVFSAIRAELTRVIEERSR